VEKWSQVVFLGDKMRFLQQLQKPDSKMDYLIEKSQKLPKRGIQKPTKCPKNIFSENFKYQTNLYF
jgi:hypothetical protein